MKCIFFIDQYTLASDANFRKNLDVDKDGTNFFRFFFPIHETSMSSSEDTVAASPEKKCVEISQNLPKNA